MLGVGFPDVVLRKLRLLELVIPHVVALTPDLLDEPELPTAGPQVDELWVQSWLCRKMKGPDGLRVPVDEGEIELSYLRHELSTGEGTYRRERLDILGVDKDEKSLVAFEIKGPDCGRVQLENLFLQGLAHQKWLEGNKMGIKFAYDGPEGGRINTRKRVRLVLGFFQEEVPELFWEMRREAMRDPYLKIDFVGFSHSGGLDGELALTRKKAGATGGAAGQGGGEARGRRSEGVGEHGCRGGGLSPRRASPDRPVHCTSHVRCT